MGRKFRVLSLSGGGFRGLYSVRLLHHLEDRLGFPIASKFDLIVGTSVGGLLAIAVAAEVPMAELAHTFEKHGPKAFKPPLLTRLFGLYEIYHRLSSSRFPQRRLRQLLSRCISPTASLASLKHDILIPAVNLSDYTPREFRSKQGAAGLDFNLTDVALATTAAPTYFPIHMINGNLFADGGIYANVPDLVAIQEVTINYSVPLEHIWMLSVGTPYTKKPLWRTQSLNWGIFRWLKKGEIIDLMQSCQEQTALFYSTRLLKGRYIRLNKFLQEDEANERLLFSTDRKTRERLNGLAYASIDDLARNEEVNHVFQQMFS